MFKENKINLLNHKIVNNENKKEINEINFNNISKINYTYHTLRLKEKKYLHHKQLKNQFDYFKTYENLITKLNKLKNKKIKFNDVKKNQNLNIKDFTRNIFVNYSRNSYLIQDIIQKDDSTEKDDLTSTSSQTKENRITDLILGLKTKRNLETETETNYSELKKNLTEEKDSIVSFENGILRIQKKEIDDSIKNEIIQDNKKVNNFFLTYYSI